jgi:flagellar basal-body rod modification protein FlgD
MTTSASAAAAAGITPTSSSISTSGTSAPAAANQAYNSKLFLKLLVTQLANQDPSSPMDSSQMVQQTASLASMEQLTSLNSTTASTNQTQMQATATAMLGKNVTWTDSSGAALSGTVSSISFSSTSAPQLTIGSKTVALSAITGVTASSTP